MLLSCLLLLVHVIHEKAKGEDVSWMRYLPAVTRTSQGHQQQRWFGRDVRGSAHGNEHAGISDPTTRQRRGCNTKIGGCPCTSCSVPPARAADAISSSAGCYWRAPGSTGALGFGSGSGTVEKKHDVNDAFHGNGSFDPKEQLQPPARPCPAVFPRQHAARHFVVFPSLLFVFFFFFNYCLYQAISVLQLSQAETFSATSAPHHSWSH